MPDEGTRRTSGALNALDLGAAAFAVFAADPATGKPAAPERTERPDKASPSDGRRAGAPCRGDIGDDAAPPPGTCAGNWLSGLIGGIEPKYHPLDRNRPSNHSPETTANHSQSQAVDYWSKVARGNSHAG
jgi:hypothetical protein